MHYALAALIIISKIRACIATHDHLAALVYLRTGATIRYDTFLPKNSQRQPGGAKQPNFAL